LEEFLVYEARERDVFWDLSLRRKNYLKGSGKIKQTCSFSEVGVSKIEL